jgi:hypothetical protein
MDRRGFLASAAALLAAPLAADVVTCLTDLARAENESEFRWLAESQGVPAECVPELWEGTVARLRRARPRQLAGLGYEAGS